eukprot:GEMP01036934.1.p1 GENE.GEMP01036934.1~~GEMP01036934.1.p1  ORF type:complete len:520 (+),score=31.57 GEMP01036934.1:76-1635(+)
MRPCGLITVHFALVFAATYLVLLLPSALDRYDFATPDICATAVVWQNRFHMTAPSRTFLVMRLSHMVNASGWAEYVPALNLKAPQLRAFNLTSLVQRSFEFRKESRPRIPRPNDRVMDCFELGGQAPVCRGVCSLYIDEDAFPSISKSSRRTWGQHADILIQLIFAAWMLGIVCKVEIARLSHTVEDYYAWRPAVILYLTTMWTFLFGSACIRWQLLGSSRPLLLLVLLALEAAHQGLTLLMVCLFVCGATSALVLIWKCVVFVFNGFAFVYRFCKFVFLEKVIDGSQRLSTEQSRSYGEDECCAICLADLHPTPLVERRSKMNLSAIRRMPKFNLAAEFYRRRNLLLGLNMCGHVFHKGCLDECYEHTPLLSLKTLCPICRASNAKVRMREKSIGIQQILDFLRDELDLTYLRAFLFVAIVAVLSSLLAEVMLYCMELMLDVLSYIHSQYRVSWPILNLPFAFIALMWTLLRQTQMSLKTILTIATSMAYPLSLLCWSMPSVVVACVVISFLLLLVQM